MKKQNLETNNNAFTLFELMVALTLLILLMLTLSTIFSAGLGIYKNHDKGLAPYKEARELFSIIDTDLNAVIPSILGGTNSELLQGEAQRLRFVTIDPVTKDTMGVRYLYNNTERVLERHTALTHSQTLPVNFTTVDIIARNVTNCSIKYYNGESSELHLTNSAATWPSIAPIDSAISEMPKAISLSVTISDQKYPDIKISFTKLFCIENR